MLFNDHSRIAGSHAFLSASNYHWLRYDIDKLAATFASRQQAALGTRLHNIAAELIRLKIKQPRNQTTFNSYVNDAIGYRMEPEQMLFASPNCFGTADAIAFKKDMLRIHDLKTGITASSMDQLCIYVAMFCIEYGIRPGDIGVELRIYQNDQIEILIPELDFIVRIIDTIRTFDKWIDSAKLAG